MKKDTKKIWLVWWKGGNLIKFICDSKKEAEKKLMTIKNHEDFFIEENTILPKPNKN